MPATYEPIATTTLGSAAASISLSSIPSTYTDLVIVFSGTQGALDNTGLRFNGDTGTNYSKTLIYGTGLTAASARDTNSSSMRIMIAGTTINSTVWHIFNYANTTTYKTALCRTDIGSDQTRAGVGLWRSTSAINQVTFLAESGNFGTGTIVSIYGIKAA
jgi:hypothetical protein